MANTLVYTAGNWSVDSKIVDTTAVTKNFVATDLSYSADYAKTKDEPTEGIITNTTGAELYPTESIRYAKSDVSNIYAGSGINTSGQLSTKNGIQVMAEIKFNLSAVNSVSGQECLLPFTGRVVLRFPTAACVTDAAVAYALRRTVSAALDTGVVTDSRILQLAKGALIPEGV